MRDRDHGAQRRASLRSVTLGFAPHRIAHKPRCCLAGKSRTRADPPTVSRCSSNADLAAPRSGRISATRCGFRRPGRPQRCQGGASESRRKAVIRPAAVGSTKQKPGAHRRRSSSLPHPRDSNRAQGAAARRATGRVLRDDCDRVVAVDSVADAVQRGHGVAMTPSGVEEPRHIVLAQQRGRGEHVGRLRNWRRPGPHRFRSRASHWCWRGSPGEAFV
jgi:hypothetical protein